MLTVLSRLGSGLLGLLAKVPTIAWLIIALASWGFYGAHQAQKVREEKAAAALQAAHAQTLASEAARAKERILTTKNLEIANALETETIARHTDARAAANRLRAAAKAHATDPLAGGNTTAACRSYDGPPAAVLSDEARSHLIELATDADEVASRLRGCQAYVRTVLTPAVAEQD